MELVYALLAAVGTSLISLIALLAIPKTWNHAKEQRLLGFAGGVLLATATLQLIPEAIELSEGMAPYYSILGGVVVFFVLERIFRGFHTHQQEKKQSKTPGHLVILGDGLHNLIDGVTIGVAFQINPAIGVGATLAIAAHEIPQEIADFIILRKSGFSRAKALTLNLASALTSIIGVLVTFAFGNVIGGIEGILLAFTAGIFLYIAAADIIPELNHDHPTGSKYALPLLSGVLIVAVLSLIVPNG